MMILSLLVSSSVVAQQSATISGHVVDELGDPVIGTSVALHRYKTVEDDERRVRFVPFWQKPVGLDGHFSFVNIAPTESVSFIVEDERTKGKILSIQMGELTLYPGDHPHFGKVRFALEAGMDIEDVVITVNTNIPPQVRARVVSADGTPLANARISIRMLRRDLDGSGSGGSGGTRQTDAEGYFVEDLRVDDDPKFYTLGIEYQGLFAKAHSFILHEGQPQVHLLLTLNGNPDPLARPPIGPPVSAALTAFLNPPAVWIVNPANGHAYKKIHCNSIADATTQAAAENAYLVSINDKAENEWLDGIFERERFWIGLNDAAEEGQLVWDSGEPVTYTNWGEHERVGNNTEVNDYVISGHGRWEMVAPGSGHANFVKTAILERTDVPVETSAEDN